jgi:hypothetical protein
MAYIGAGITRFNTADELTVTGDAQIDGTTLVVDSTNNNVGIGTASPDGSSFSGSSSPVVNISGTRPLLILSETDSNTKNAWVALSGDEFFLGGTNTSTRFYTANAEAMRITSGGLVGIGESNPSFDVGNTGIHIGGASSPAIRLKSTTTGSGDWEIYADSASTGGLGFYEHQNNATYMYLSEGGLLGIGTSSPDGLVHAYSGNSGQTANSNANQLIAENSGNAGISIMSGASSLGNIYFSDSGSVNNGYIRYNHSTDQLQLKGESDILFLSQASSEKMRITSGGNVGIGTASAFNPGGVNSLLSVAGNLTVTKNQGAHTNIDVFNNSGSASAKGQIRVGYDASNCLEIFRVGNNANITLNATQNGAIIFQGAGTEMMRMSTTGLAIGGTGSANTLDDYEVGTFSPTLDLASNITSAAVDNYDYVKIGNLVHVTFTVSGSVTNASNVVEFRITVPFNGATNNDWHDVGVVSLVTGSGQNQFGMGVITRGGTSFNQVNVYVQGNQVNATGTISTWLRGTLTYRAG